ncbi:DUF3048 domain-containing protein, partial [Chloroflexota bacterium]
MRLKHLLQLILVCAILAACGPTTRPSDLRNPSGTFLPGEDNAGVSEEVISPSPQPQSPPKTPHAELPGVGPGGFPAGVNPLTGLKVDDPEVLERRPVGVKINNYPRSDRPQWGLSLADIVYEYYHNNELPRFHAIFYGQNAETVGPIRSARPFDGYLVEMYKLNFVFASADSRVLERLVVANYSERLIYQLDGECPPYPVCRHNPNGDNYLITNTAVIEFFLGQNARQPDLDGMWFYDSMPDGGYPVERLYLRYSFSAYLYWKYDPKTDTFLRFQDIREDVGGAGEAYQPLTDRLNDRQISAANVVVLVIPHLHRVYQPPQGGQPAIEIVDMEFSGSGPAYALRGGRLYEVRWVRPNKQSVLYLEFPDGNPYPYAPGNTWYQ